MPDPRIAAHAEPHRAHAQRAERPLPDAGRADAAADAALYVVLSIDVEEEGLFGGSYSASAAVRNVACLSKLVPLLRNQAMPITLLCAHSVFSDSAACAALDALRRQCAVEIGAHLHHWSTPPLEPDLRAEHYRSAGEVAEEVMAAKLHTLFDAGQRYAGHALTSFRMGRWDLHRSHWPLLARCGVLTDSSVRPLHCGTGQPTPAATMPDHFAAPAHPYRVQVPLHGALHEIFEAPLTCVPLVPPLRPLLQGLPRSLRAKVQKCGALATQPVYHPLWALRWITKAQLAQGQRVLHLTWHSSEMMPGGAPHIPDEAAVQALLQRIESWLVWLRSYWTAKGPAGAHVRGVTLNELRQACTAASLVPPAPENEDSGQGRPHAPSVHAPHFPSPLPSCHGADWTYGG